MSKNIDDILNVLGKQAGFKLSRKEAFDTNCCTQCGKEATKFHDALSKKEYEITGFCQECQDDFFGKEDE